MSAAATAGIHYETAGNGPPLVLLHGIGSNSRSWRRQLRGLSDRYTVIAWDAPGYGGSREPVGPGSVATYADDLEALLGTLVDEPVHLIGHSLGGIIAQEFYGRYPERVRTLVLADTSRGGGAEEELVRNRKLETRLKAIAEQTPRQIAEHRAPALLRAAAPLDLVREAVEIMAEIRPAGYRFAAEALAEADETSILARIAVPTLLIWGADDRITPLGEGRRMAATIPGSRLEVIPDAGHLCYLERASIFNSLIESFCAAAVPTPTPGPTPR